MTTEQLSVALHALLILMSGIGLLYLVEAKGSLDKYCALMERHVKALEDFTQAVKGK